MPFNGSGTFNPLPAPTYPAVTGDIIYADRFNSNMQDVFDGLSACLTRDGQGKPSTNFNFNGYKGIGMALGANPGDAVEYTQLAAKVSQGALTTSGLTIATARLAGRTTAGTGAFEEIAVQAPLTYSGGILGVTPGIGTGTVVGPVSSVDSEIVLMNGTSGNSIKSMTGSGLVKVASGVASTVTAPSGAVVGDTDVQTLTNKTLTTPVVNSGTLNTPTLATPASTGGTFAAITSFGLRNIGAGAFDILHAANGTMTANRTLSWNLSDANRLVTLAGDLSFPGGLTLVGAFATVMRMTAATDVTFPVTGTLATLAGAETLTNKILTSPTLNSATSNTPTINTPSLNNTNVTSVKAVGFNAEFDNGNSGTTKTVTMSAGMKQKLTLTGNVALTVDWTGALVGQHQLRLIQDVTGGRSVTYTAGLSASRWLGATSAPALNTAANGETIITMFFDGTNATQSLSKVGAV